MDDERVKLQVMGITYSQVQQGAYALVLAQADGPYRIPIVVGIAEAQAIAVRLENIIPPRPMPHDLFVSLAHAFGIQLEEVFISDFDNGVFMLELTFSNDSDKTVVLDSRTSDAIALALRTGAPIYTTGEIMMKTGFKMGEQPEHEDAGDGDNLADPGRQYEYCSIEKLEKMLQSCVDHEEYEIAAEIKKVIDKKKAKKQEED